MANWCSTRYALRGEATEIRRLYDLMVSIQDKGKSTTSDFYYWLGDLVTALGEDWHKVYCRGEWSDLEMEADNIITLNTETAWSPMDDVFKLICKKFPSIECFYQAEEPGCELFVTNDAEHEFFTDYCILDVCSPNGEYLYDYYENAGQAYQALSELAGKPITCDADIDALVDEWENCETAYCNYNKFEIEK